MYDDEPADVSGGFGAYREQAAGDAGEIRKAITIK